MLAMSEGNVQNPQQQFVAYRVRQKSGSESNGAQGEKSQLSSRKMQLTTKKDTSDNQGTTTMGRKVCEQTLCLIGKII